MIKNRNIIVIILFLTFTIKGIFFDMILPVFQGPDEAMHYATAQFKAEPSTKYWDISKKDISKNTEDIETFNFSEEIIETAKVIGFDTVKFKEMNTNVFSKDEEEEITTNNWSKYIERYPADVVTNAPAYYLIPSIIEKVLSDQNLLTRFHLIRFFSVIVGVLIILLSYLAMIKIGLDKKFSLIITAIISLQPMFNQASAIINYDIMLIFAYSMFFYGSVVLLKNGIKKINIAILFIATIFGVLTKGPGMLLLILLLIIIAYDVYERQIINKKRYLLFISLSILLSLVIYINLVPNNYLNLIFNLPKQTIFSSVSESFFKYLETTMNRWEISELSYWGNFGWLDTKISSWILIPIWILEAIALVGVAIGLFMKKIPEYLPERKYVIFSIAMLLSLQLLIRFYDWTVFNSTGKILIGTPGRYFLPNIIPHFIVFFFGLGIIARKKKYFEMILAFSLVLMVSLFLYSVINVIIPRYYL